MRMPVGILQGMALVGKSVAGWRRFPNDGHRLYGVCRALAGD